MIDPNYRPEPGIVIVQEVFMHNAVGAPHLRTVRVTLHVRLPRGVEHTAKQRYPYAQLRHTLDEYGDAAEIEIPLRLTDDDLQPYLAWRDSLLKRVYGDIYGDT